MKTKTKPVMTPKHPQWRKFCNRLAGPKYCAFSDDFKWKCNGQMDRPFATKLLKAMGADVPASLAYFEAHGGYCDCEILFNVDR